MKIITYEATGETPDGKQAVARIWNEGWHPVAFHAQTSEEACEKAASWWDEQLARENRRRATSDATSARMRAAAEARRMGAPVSKVDAGVSAVEEDWSIL